jgi:transcriptional regulator with XRE-family HTH domain
MTTAIERFESVPEGKRLLDQERLILQATEAIIKLMQQQDVSRTELARRLGRSKGWISQLLAGEANFTLRTLADVFGALERRAVIDVEICLDGAPRHALPNDLVAGPVMWRLFPWALKCPQDAGAPIPEEMLAG